MSTSHRGPESVTNGRTFLPSSILRTITSTSGLACCSCDSGAYQPFAGSGSTVMFRSESDPSALTHASGCLAVVTEHTEKPTSIHIALISIPRHSPFPFIQMSTTKHSLPDKARSTSTAYVPEASGDEVSSGQEQLQKAQGSAGVFSAKYSWESATVMARSG